MLKLKQLQEKLAKVQADLGKVFEEAGDELDFSKVKSIPGTDTEKAAKVREMNDECGTIQKEIEPLLSVEKAREEYNERQKAAAVTHPAAVIVPAKGEEPKRMGFGEAFIKAGAHLSVNRHKEIALDLGVNLKTLFETGAGWAPQNIRSGKLVESAQRPIQVLDLIPGGRTGQAAVVYMEETTFTNNAAEAAEAAQYGEAALALTERSSAVRKIAVFIPVTDEQLEDVVQIQGYLDRRLRFMLEQRMDSQLVNGNGIAPNLDGILNVDNIQSHNKSANAGDLVPDAIRRAMTKVRIIGRAVPSGIIMNPYDWDDIRLLKTNDGVYIWGSPAEAGPERLWGQPVALADSLAQGKAIVGDFAQFCELAEKRGIEVKVSNSHSDYFIKGKQAIRADCRCAFPVYRPSAFCEVNLTA